MFLENAQKMGGERSHSLGGCCMAWSRFSFPSQLPFSPYCWAWDDVEGD